MQFSTDIRNGWLDDLNAKLGTGAVVNCYFGSPPASCAASDSGSIIAQGNLPSTPFQAASSGSATGASLPWTITGQAAAGAGTVMGHFRAKTAAGVCKMQGTIAVGSGDLQVNSATITSGATGAITGWTLNAPNG